MNMRHRSNYLDELLVINKSICFFTTLDTQKYGFNVVFLFQSSDYHCIQPTVRNSVKDQSCSIKKKGFLVYSLQSRPFWLSLYRQEKVLYYPNAIPKHARKTNFRTQPPSLSDN